MARIVSGGQTGVDRAALDAGLQLGIEIGGWVPRGRRAEDGRVPDRYVGLEECASGAYETRTELNVRDSDATLILYYGLLAGGSALTQRIAVSLGKPVLAIDLSEAPVEQNAARIREWLIANKPAVLNVAGPRESERPTISQSARELLTLALDSGAA